MQMHLLDARPFQIVAHGSDSGLGTWRALHRRERRKVSVMQTVWQTESDRLVCRWSDVPKPAQCCPSWVENESETNREACSLRGVFRTFYLVAESGTA